MTYQPHVRVSMGGLLQVTPGEADIWNCNVNVVRLPDAGVAVPTGGLGIFTPTGGTGAAFDVADYLESIASHLPAWFNAAGSGISGGAKLNYVKANWIGADGKYSDSTVTHVHDYTAPASGGATPINPDIISLCTSWGTTRARGPGSHGRIYLPNPTWGDGNTMRVSAAQCTAAANAGKALLAILADVDNAQGQVVPVVASKVDNSLSIITSVRVGDVKDVQRRRKNALAEAYQSVSI